VNLIRLAPTKLGLYWLGLAYALPDVGFITQLNLDDLGPISPIWVRANPTQLGPTFDLSWVRFDLDQHLPNPSQLDLCPTKLGIIETRLNLTWHGLLRLGLMWTWVKLARCWFRIIQPNLGLIPFGSCESKSTGLTLDQPNIDSCRLELTWTRVNWHN